MVPVMDYMEERKGSYTTPDLNPESRDDYVHTEDDDKFHEMVSA